MTRLSIFVIVIVACQLINVKSTSDVTIYKISTGINDFSTKFYQALVSENNGKNIICSPLSMYFVLYTWAIRGGAGEGKTNLESILNLPNGYNNNSRPFRYIVDRLQFMDRVEIGLKSKLFLSYSADVKSIYDKYSWQYYQCEFKYLSFHRSIEATNEINNWCAEATNQRVKNIITTDEFEDASLIVACPAYFSGEWIVKFQNFSHFAPFYVDNDKTVNVTMMTSPISRWSITEIHDLDAKCIEFGYQNEHGDYTDFSMYIIMPNNGVSLERIEKNFHKLNFNRIESNDRYLSVHLPKFRFENKLNLVPIIKKMGAGKILEDVNYLRDITNDIEVKTSKIIQKAFLEVNENGTGVESTGVQFVTTIPPAANFNSIVINKPFICTIVMKDTGVPLFHARVVNPLAGI